ncbi:MAG: hypothetical protein NUV51_01670 [Sulfuricaulis sp.]|nr:hypothetical protein [Sulfuricaulis sp.]
MAAVRKLPLSETLITKIQQQIKLHCEVFSSDTIDLETFGHIPGARNPKNTAHWPVREAFDYFHHLGTGRLTGTIFKVLEREYFGIGSHQTSLSFSFTIDDRIRSELPAMLDVYAQIYDAENRVRFFLHQKLQDKYGPNFVFHLPTHVRDRIEHEKLRHHNYVIDPLRGDLEFAHLSDLKRIIDANEEFVADNQVRAVLLQKIEYLNSIRHLASHNNLILPAEIMRIRDHCELIRLIIGTGTLGLAPFSPSPAGSKTDKRTTGRETAANTVEIETELV